MSILEERSGVLVSIGWSCDEVERSARHEMILYDRDDETIYGQVSLENV
jgi:hypothetical protein